MTGKEAKKILECILDICDHLDNDDQRHAYYYLGMLTERLEQIIAIDQVSFNPTLKDKNEEE